jgi:PII-like signaling protein
MVCAGEQAQHHGHPLYVQLARRLLHQGAAGATTLCGVWGYHGDHPPHRDRLLDLRRQVPVLTVVVDTPTRIRRWFPIVDELTDQTGLVTCETVPAFRAGDRRGGLRLSSIPARDTRGTAR